MTRRTSLLLAFALLFTVATRAQSNSALHHVRKIHIAAMGADAEAERFHTLLQDELRNAGFEIADSASADATLAGEFSSGAHGDYSFAHATLTLKSIDGKRILWSGDYVSEHKGTTREDVVKTLAQTCAERFHRDWEKN